MGNSTIQLSGVEEYSTVQWRSTVQYSGAVQYSTVEQYSTVQWSSTVLYSGGVQFSTVEQYSTVQYNSVFCCGVKCIQCSSMLQFSNKLDGTACYVGLLPDSSCTDNDAKVFFCNVLNF